MKNTIINIGIIGFGKTGKERFKILQKEKKVKIHSICDQLEIKKKYKEINYTNNPEILIKNKEITAVFISVPNYLNKKLVIKCLKNNKHVFCEKPPTLNSKEMLEVIKIEKKTKLKLMYGFNHRHHESVQRMKKIIDTNQLGKVLWMRGRYGKSVDKNFFDTWRSKKKYSGGGILMDQGIHMLDLMRYFSGQSFTHINSFVTTSYWDIKSEDNAFAIMQSDEKVTAMLHSSATQWKHKFLLEMCFEEGYINLDGILSGTRSYSPEKLVVGRREFEDITFAMGKPKENTTWFENDDSWKFEIDEFVNSILGNTKIKHGTSKDAYETLRLVERIYENSGFYSDK